MFPPILPEPPRPPEPRGHHSRGNARFFPPLAPLAAGALLGVSAWLAAPGFARAAAAEPSRFLVEAENFQFPGNWYVEGGGGTSGTGFLRTGNSEADAMTVVTLPTAGRYHLWVRARDFATQDPKKRRYLLVVDGQPADTEAGQHGQEGWRWEAVGTRDLTAGDHVLGLRDTTHFYPRCDAIYLSTGDEDPNAAELKGLAKFRLEPKTVPFRDAGPRTTPPALTAVPGARPLAQIAGDAVRVSFLPAKDAAGRPAVLRATEIRQHDAWMPVPVAPGQESLFLVYSPKSDINTSVFTPFWPGGAKINFEVNGKSYESRGGRNPFTAGDVDLLTPRTCRVRDAETVEMEYEGAAGRKVSTVWQVRKGRRDVSFQATFTADKGGDYSLGFSAFQAWPKEELEFGLMPPLYNFQRLPTSPSLALSSTMPHALSLVQAPLRKAGGGGGGDRFTFVAAADPQSIPLAWPNARSSPYGFALLNAAGKVQPTVFSPVLGMPDSRMSPGQSRTVSWSLLASTGDWKESLEYASDKIFGVTDYRRSHGGSLTDAALNMMDLLKDDEHGGWDAKLKGFYNIESRDTGTQASPLPVMEAAILSRDEDLYRSRALPTLEYTLSRPGAHFATDVPVSTVPYVTAQTTRITVPSDFYGASYWQGVDDLFGRDNPWLGEYAYQNGKPRTNSASGSVPPWSDLLGAYRLDPRPERLEEIKTAADAYLKSSVYGPQTKDLGTNPFYNVSFYPYWWDLVDLYELTHEDRYLRAAEEGAFHTVAGQWSQPAVGPGEVTTFPGGKLGDKEPILWVKGGKEFRLGFPLQPGSLKEKAIPQWLASRVGLGLEQPITYYGGGGGFQNILMSCWAPHLLRVYEYTGRDILQTYARNAVIGRFNNYPGYYYRLYSDLHLSARYPYEGPDVTSIYYHHIAPHLGFTLDFIFTEAEVRSKGKIRFPWVKQQGYVWFTNRIYGHAPGTVFNDENMWPQFERGTVKVGSEQITYLPARSDQRYALVLMNESPEAQSTTVALDAEKLGLDLGKPYRVNVNGEERTLPPGSFHNTVDVPARGTVVLSFATHGQPAVPTVPVLDTRPVEQTLTGDWGTLHAFRIRSPFAKDSLYVVLTGRPAKGSRAQLVLDGQSNAAPEATSYPYEFSVYPLPMNADLTFHLVCTDAAGKATESRPITLKGTASR